MANYKKWLSQSIDNIKLQLRSGDYIEYDILTGAIFLKFLYAKANGNYNIAVRNYNGSKHKLAYQKAIINNAHKVFELYSAEELNDCENDVRYEFNIQRTACLIDEEPVECFEDYVSMLPNRT